jgi:hypothetical protein
MRKGLKKKSAGADQIGKRGFDTGVGSESAVACDVPQIGSLDAYVTKGSQKNGAAGI